jgi:hypothetical protein
MLNVAGLQLKNNRPINATAKTKPAIRSTITVTRFIMNPGAPISRQKNRLTAEKRLGSEKQARTRMQAVGNSRMLIHERAWRHCGGRPRCDEKAGMLNPAKRFPGSPRKRNQPPDYSTDTGVVPAMRLSGNRLTRRRARRRGAARTDGFELRLLLVR